MQSWTFGLACGFKVREHYVHRQASRGMSPLTEEHQGSIPAQMTSPQRDANGMLLKVASAHLNSTRSYITPSLQHKAGFEVDMGWMAWAFVTIPGLGVPEEAQTLANC
eukprot:2279709-Amphidinium_carterae.1